MAIETYTAQLERVQTLIAALETSGVEESDHNGIRLRRQRLADLYAREDYLRQKVTEEDANDGVADGPIRVRGLTPYVS